MPSIPACLKSGKLPIILSGLGALGGLGCGLFTTYNLIWTFTSVRVSILYIYLTFIAYLIIITELGILRHPAIDVYARFLTRNFGRGCLYIFYGGILLSGWGFVVGIYMIVAGLLNVLLAMGKLTPSSNASSSAPNPAGNLEGNAEHQASPTFSAI